MTVRSYWYLLWHITFTARFIERVWGTLHKFTNFGTGRITIMNIAFQNKVNISGTVFVCFLVCLFVCVELPDWGQWGEWNMQYTWRRREKWPTIILAEQPRQLAAKVQRFLDLLCPHHQGMITIQIPTPCLPRGCLISIRKSLHHCCKSLWRDLRFLKSSRLD